MERGFEQLILIVVILLAAVFDFVVRWLRRRQGKDESVGAGPADEQPLLLEEHEIELPEAPAVERGLPLPPPAPAEVPVVFRRPLPPPAIKPPRVARRLLRQPLDARRGIVMMAVLGPCRGLQAADREA